MTIYYGSGESSPSITEILNGATEAATAQGLHFFGVSSLDVSRDFKWFQEWLDESRHGSMEWMTNHLKIRENPEYLLPNAKVAFTFGFPYSLGDKWSRGNNHEPPRIAQYARLKDYHKFLRAKLERIQSSLENISGKSQTWRIAVDSAPLLERALAANAGGAFVGKNTCVIHAKKGSFFLLGEILTSWDFHPADTAPQPDTRHKPRTEAGGCGTCKRCQVHCPTGALDEDYRIDARKCLSYWTIEHRGEIPLEYWPWIARYIFGCDICQLVCPYNRGLEPSQEAQSLVKISSTPDLIDMITMDQRRYETLFGGTPMTRAKRSGLRRNALIAGVVNKDARLFSIIKLLEQDEDPVIRATLERSKTYLENQKF
jgi:epoxyqueuosine reductase